MAALAANVSGNEPKTVVVPAAAVWVIMLNYRLIL